MQLIEPRTMQGVMELLPMDQINFQRMLDIIRKNYELFGFLPIETPVMEFTKVLLTKSGGETERQVYFVQSTGTLQKGKDPELALRFDLTVPLARYVAEHESMLTFPFRRYQMQRVYRGETAQRGRFREFYQCDIDVIGKDKLSLQFDAEIPVVIYHVFKELNAGKFTINVNNRKIMIGLFRSFGIENDQYNIILREIDKLDKVGRASVELTLMNLFNLSSEQIGKIMAIIDFNTGTNEEILQKLRDLNIQDACFQEGVKELASVVFSISKMGVPESYCHINLAIARGLDYYTGSVYETTLDDHPQIGSVCSGGRYENLAGYYTKSHLPGVGISIGATRLFYQLQEAGLIRQIGSSVTALVTRFDESYESEYLTIASKLRLAGINTEIFFENSKIGNQLKYVDRAGIRFAIILGSNEITNHCVTIKDLQQSDQITLPQDEMSAWILKRMEQ